MSRFFTLAMAAVLAACIGPAAWSLGDQAGGGAGASGGASGSGGTSGSGSTAGAAGQAGTAGGAQAGAGQAGAGQVGAGQVGAGQVGAGQFGNDRFAPGMQGSGIGRTPFFTNPGARQQLGLDDNRFNTLNRAFQQSRDRFNQGVAGLDPNLTEQQRRQQMMQLENQFNQNFNRTLDTTFTDPRMRTRFNQLNWQFQGFGAFENPMVRQQLDITPAQQRQFRQVNAEWRRQLQQMRRAGNDQNARLTQEQMAQLRQQHQQQLQTLLTPEQQQRWTRLIGQEFPVDPGWDFWEDQPQNPAGVELHGGANARIGARNQGGVDTQNTQSQNQGTQNQNNQGTVR